MPAWIAKDEPARAQAALHVVQNAHEHGLEPSDYGEQGIERLLAMETSQESRDKDELDRLRSGVPSSTCASPPLCSLSAVTSRLAESRRRPSIRAGKLVARSPDFVATLTAAMAGDVNTWLETIRPQASAVRRTAESPGGSARAAGAGAAGRSVSPDPGAQGRLKQLELNLERWRWMPDDLGARHIIVNIPSFQLLARENGQAVLEMRVVVGKPEQQERPIFSDVMTTSRVQPILERPGQHRRRRDGAGSGARSGIPGAKQHRDPARSRSRARRQWILRRSNWDDPEELKALAFRQTPGAKNAWAT